MLSIGPLELSSNLILAPLAGVSDLPYRLINRRMGCELAFIEMTSTHALERRNKRTMKMVATVPEDSPLGIQLLGTDEGSMLKALEVVHEEPQYQVVDLNAACPVKKVVRRGEGAAAMKEPEKLGSMLRLMVRNTDRPVTVKIRAGWDADSINARDVALRAQDAGVSALFIHGRTRTQGYGGTPDYNVIRQVREAIDIPVIASGDILSPELAKKMFDETGCHGLVVARGSMGNPWIFRQIESFMATGTASPVPSMHDVISTIEEHMKLNVDYYGEALGIKIFKKNVIWYTRGMNNIKPLRPKANHITTMDETRELLEEIQQTCTL